MTFLTPLESHSEPEGEIGKESGFETYSMNVTTLILSSLFTVFVFKVYFAFMRRDTRIRKCLDQIPGPPVIPILGCFATNIHIAADHRFLYEEMVLLYGRRFRVWILNRGMVFLTSAADFKKILSSKVHINKPLEYDFFRPWLGFGLFISGGKQWSDLRKLLTPAFKKPDDNIPVYNEYSRILVDVLKSNYSDGTQFDISIYFTRITLDVVTAIFLGKENCMNALRMQNGEYEKAMHGMADLLSERTINYSLLPNWMWILSHKGRAEKKLLEVIHKFSADVVAKAVKERRQRFIPLEEAVDASETEIHHCSDVAPLKIDQRGFIGLFISDSRHGPKEYVYPIWCRYVNKFESYGGHKQPECQSINSKGTALELLLNAADDGKLTEFEVRGEINSVIFGGHDTTAGALAWAVFLLAVYPEHQKLVQNELDGILGEDRYRDFTANDVCKMKYLECCIKESLRIYPVVPGYQRHLTEDCILYDGQIIPSGCTTTLIVFALHRDPTVFPNPEEFIPERFTPENSAGRDLYAFAPFCAGPRNCLGQKGGLTQMKVILAHLFRSFTLESVNNRENIELKFNFMLGSKNGFPMKLTERKNDSHY